MRYSDTPELIHLANAGFMIRYKTVSIMIDAIHRERQFGYEALDARLFDDIMACKKGFVPMDILIFTHSHGDHFDAQWTAAYLKEHKKTIVIGSEGVVEMLVREPDCQCYEDRVICAKTYEDKMMDVIGEVSLRAFVLNHLPYRYQGKRYMNYENYGYLIDISGFTLMHLGDAQVSEQNIKVLSDAVSEVDLALINYPFITKSVGLEMLNKNLKTKNIGIIHLPREDMDRFKVIQHTEQILLSQNNMDCLSKVYKKSYSAIYSSV